MVYITATSKKSPMKTHELVYFCSPDFIEERQTEEMTMYTNPV